MKRIVELHGIVVVALVAAALAPAAPRAAPGARTSTLSVFAAASLSDAFDEMGRSFEAAHSGWKVRMILAGSQQLATQIEQGARADVFASADERWMTYARDRGLIDGDAATFTRNRLVLIVPRTNPARIRRLQDLSRTGIKLVVGADAVPVGHYSRIVLRHLAKDPAYPPDFATRALRNVVSEEENVKSVVGKVQLGEADAGFVYRSDVTPAVARYVRAFEIPDGANVIAEYPIAVVRGTASPAEARAFIDLVRSPEGQQILARHGLMPLAAAP